MDHQSIVRRLVFIGLLLVPGLTQAMEHFVRPLQDQNGRAIAGATVSVYLAGSTTLATLYSDSARTVKGNPITTGVDGMMDFYAPNGLYDLAPVAKGYVFNVNQYKRLALVDPAEIGGGPPGSCIRTVSGTSDSILSTDSGCIIVYTASGVVVATIPQAGSTGFSTSFNVTVLNLNASQLIISPIGSTIQAEAELIISAGQSTDIRSDGSNYYHAPGQKNISGWPQSDQIKEITWAASESSAEAVGDGTRKMRRWCDATVGCIEKPDPIADTYWRIWDNLSGCIRDMEANGGLGANVLCFDPDAATANGKYPFQSGYYPIASFLLPLEPRGAATAASESIVTNQPKAWYLTLTDANTDAADFSFPVTAKMAGATTATFRLVGVSKNATPSGNIDLDCAISSYTPGADTFAAHVTTGEVTALLTPATQNRPVAVTTSAHTINGGALVAGDVLYGSCEVDATATTSAQMTDFRLWGYVLVQLSVNSLSD